MAPPLRFCQRAIAAHRTCAAIASFVVSVASAPHAAGFRAYASYTRLSGKFANDATTGLPPQLVPAGARLPGVPLASAYAEMTGSYPRAAGFEAALEMQYVGNIYVNDRNTDAAPASTMSNVRISFEQRGERWVLREFARLNNLTNRSYVGTVIVGDANGRYFEPAAKRNALFGISIGANY